MTITYRATFTVVGRELREEHDATKPLSAYSTAQSYLVLGKNKATLVVDLSLALRREPRLDLTMTVGAFVAERMTEVTVNRYLTDKVPLKDPETGRYPKRIDTLNANAEATITVAYTSLATPEVRNDQYQRDGMNDLVITTSDGRNLAHCLVSVNGVFHKTVYYPLKNELFVIEGFANIKNVNKAEIVIFDTHSLGGHTVLPIDPRWIANVAGQDPWRSVYLDLDERKSLAGKTVLLVVDGYLYALDDTYQINGERRVKINTNRMDLINNFLHNPNTRYSAEAVGNPTNPYESVTEAVEVEQPPPTLADTISHYLEHQHPFANQSANFDPSLTAVIRYEWTDLYPKTPSVAARINHFLDTLWDGFGAVDTRETPVALIDIGFTNEYDVANKITKTIPIENLTTPDFVLSALASKHSFLIVLNTPVVYKRVYPLTLVQGVQQYERFDKDQPRGILLFNRHKTFPYAIMSAQDGQHTVMINHTEFNTDAYKTSINLKAVASPYFDPDDTGKENLVELVEFYAP